MDGSKVGSSDTRRELVGNKIEVGLKLDGNRPKRGVEVGHRVEWGKSRRPK